MRIDGVDDPNAWWRCPENFDAPLVLFIDWDQEMFVFGQRDLYLRRIEEHTNTFIQLEQWFTASGQTRVTVVGPLRVKQWLKDMFQGMSSENLYLHLLGLSMLRHVQERPLTSADLEDYFRTQS
ncbi:hypothetical protein U0070_012967 [Myodes glareolus]|uniref:KH-like RNA-binding domain-containing protein n=1 Tax=Myodes glareolus TaxID=447135 RepID=A0AAW0JFJ0_MYOGA|nr:putative KHDC1-like protein isoform X1 [Myodes glareolus]XP_048286428.1 putative KHDC1-like protein isoform X1 [Myodes glareolus]